MTAHASAWRVQGAWSLAALGLPASLVLAIGVGLALMAGSGCRWLPMAATRGGIALVVLALAALLASLAANGVRARRAYRLVLRVASPVAEPALLAEVARQAGILGAPLPELRAVPLDAPLAMGVLGRQPLLVVSTWVLAHLEEAELAALIAHELAHMRRADRWVRWVGSWLLGTVGRTGPGRRAWDRLDDAMEDRADEAVLLVAGDVQALASARRKFAGSIEAQATSPFLLRAMLPASLGYRLGVATLGVVVALPFLPLILVPVCDAVCAVSAR